MEERGERMWKREGRGCGRERIEDVEERGERMWKREGRGCGRERGEGVEERGERMWKREGRGCGRERGEDVEEREERMWKREDREDHPSTSHLHMWLVLVKTSDVYLENSTSGHIQVRHDSKSAALQGQGEVIIKLEYMAFLAEVGEQDRRI